MASRKSGRSPARVSHPATSSTTPLLRYTLKRDGDRDLQFDGVEVAAFESGDLSVTHRAAIYRTRGGKYVAEFSSREAPKRSRYRDPSSTPNPLELEDFKEILVGAVIQTAEWREGKAEQFPHDARNSLSARALRGLASVLDEIPANDANWVAIWRTEYDLDVDDDEGFLIGERRNEARSAFLRGYGFGNCEIDVTQEDAAVFLKDLREVLDDAAHQNDEPVRESSKVQAFETLDEAVKSFRPGYLTTELLRLLGRMDPEFID